MRRHKSRLLSTIYGFSLSLVLFNSGVLVQSNRKAFVPFMFHFFRPFILQRLKSLSFKKRNKPFLALKARMSLEMHFYTDVESIL